MKEEREGDREGRLINACNKCLVTLVLLLEVLKIGISLETLVRALACLKYRYWEYLFLLLSFSSSSSVGAVNGGVQYCCSGVETESL